MYKEYKTCLHAKYAPTQPNMTGGPELFAKQRIRLAAAGALHLSVVAEDSAVYTCGYGANAGWASATSSGGGA